MLLRSMLLSPEQTVRIKREIEQLRALKRELLSWVDCSDVAEQTFEARVRVLELELHGLWPRRS